MQRFKPSELIAHPQNEFFFDNMEGQKWQEFLESVKTSGVIEPPVVTAEGVIVSGHQRVRACIELGIEEIYCEVRKYENTDRVLKDLIETNIRQRGTIAGSEMKMGRVWDELKRIYGIRHGKNQYEDRTSHNEESSTREELAKKMGKSASTLDRYAELGKMIPEVQTILEEKRITATTASSLIMKLTEEEQLALLEKLPSAQKFTQAQVQQYIDQIKGLEREKRELQEVAVEAVRVADGASAASEDGERYVKMAEDVKKYKEAFTKADAELTAEKKKPKGLSEEEVKKRIEREIEAVKRQYQRQADDLTERINDLEDREPEVIERIPDDYDELKRAKAELDAIKNSEDPDVSKQILRIHTDDRTPEQRLEGYGQRLLRGVNGFLPELRGLEVQFDLCEKLPDVTKKILRESIAEIQQILVRLDNSIMGGKNECRTA